MDRSAQTARFLNKNRRNGRQSIPHNFQTLKKHEFWGNIPRNFHNENAHSTQNLKIIRKRILWEYSAHFLGSERTRPVKIDKKRRTGDAG